MNTRDRAIYDIEQLYGLDTSKGMAMLADAVMWAGGASVLPDAVLLDLARRQREADSRNELDGFAVQS